MKLQITINVPDEIGRQLRQLPDTENFVGTLLKQALESRDHKIAEERTSQKETDPESLKKSRWARFSERIRKNPPLTGAGEYVRECSREFRDEFAFKHDSE
jgi:hypothetical protein